MTKAAPVFRSLAIAALAMAGAGCKDQYQDVVDRQVANWKEIAGILSVVKDRPTMDEAEAKLRSRVGQFQEVSRRARALPPPDAETMRRLAGEKATMQAAIRDMLKEVERVKDLPEGPAFFERIKDSLPGMP
jgi:hypothetical protein